jgi:hypothetical protein
MCGYMFHATTQCAHGVGVGSVSLNGTDSIEPSESVSGVMNKDKSIVNASIVVRMCESENDSVSGSGEVRRRELLLLKRLQGPFYKPSRSFSCFVLGSNNHLIVCAEES